MPLCVPVVARGRAFLSIPEVGQLQAAVDLCLMASDGVVMPTGRVMALDVGKVRVGVALSDPLGYTAQPLLTLWRKRRGEDLRSLLRLIRKYEVVAIVVGNPLHMSGDVSRPSGGGGDSAGLDGSEARGGFAGGWDVGCSVVSLSTRMT